MPRAYIGFETFKQFARTMTTRRLDILRQVHCRPVRSMTVLAQARGRPPRRVREDVQALVKAGLLDMDASGLRADDQILHMQTSVALSGAGSPRRPTEPETPAA